MFFSKNRYVKGVAFDPERKPADNATVTVIKYNDFTLVTFNLADDTCGFELSNLGLNFKRQQIIAVIYDDITMDLGFRADLITEDKLMIELKFLEAVAISSFRLCDFA